MPNQSPQRITEVYTTCQFREKEDISQFVPIKGWASLTAFHRERLLMYREEITELVTAARTWPDEHWRALKSGMRVLSVSWHRDGVTYRLSHCEVERLYQLVQAMQQLEA